MKRASSWIGAFLATVTLASHAPAADGQSAWEEIMATKTLKACVTAYPPNSFKDRGGEWHGFAVEMAKDAAKSLNASLTLVESSFKSVILDLQSGRCHALFGLAATPERSLAMDFAGPMYVLSFMILGKKDVPLPGNRWADLNRPEVKVSVVLGSSQEQLLNRYAPKATKIALVAVDEAVLAVQAGRADVYLGAVLDVLASKSKAPGLGDPVSLVPASLLASYAGTRFDSDGRLTKFLQRWGEYNRSVGKTTDWILNSLVETGIDRSIIPSDVQF